MSLYLAVELCALAIPLALSFDKKVAYYRNWIYILPSILITGCIFVLIDIYFTTGGAWGFNPDHHSGIMFSGLPLEELLFFIIIPYSSIFIHFVFIAYFPQAAISTGTTRNISYLLTGLMIIVAVIYKDRIYTFFYSILTAIVVLLTTITKTRILSVYYLTFLIIMIPFIIVNGILTGSFGAGEVFWYDPAAISGIRILSIPVEDALFGFNLVLVNLVISDSIMKFLNK